MATYLPASLGHLTFALDQPWFWKHIPIQFAWGTASMFLSAYTLATLHEVRISVSSSDFGQLLMLERLAGAREGSQMGTVALHLTMDWNGPGV